MASKKGGLGRGLGSIMDALDAKPISIFEEKPKRKASEKTVDKKPVEKVDNSGIKPKKEKSSGKPAKAEKPVKEVKPQQTEDIAGQVIYIPLDDIKPNSKQPRRVFDEEALNELADSIKTYGLIQPIVVRQYKNGFELVSGERRWRAARKAGLKKIPAIVREFTEQENALIALLENMQREDLNMIEEAQGLAALMSDYGLTQEEVAKAVGKSRPYISNALRLLKLPKEVQDMVEAGVLSTGHAKAIAGLTGKDLQLEVAKKAAKEGWSVRKIESYTTSKKPKQSKKKSKKDAAFKEVEEKLSQSVGTKVLINGSESRGKIEIEYYSRAELDRLIELLSEE